MRHRSKKTERLFLHFASDDLEICNKIVWELGLQSVKSRASLDRMLNASQDVMCAWEKVKLKLRRRWEAVEPVEVSVNMTPTTGPDERYRRRQERRAAQREAA